MPMFGARPHSHDAITNSRMLADEQAHRAEALRQPAGQRHRDRVGDRERGDDPGALRRADAQVAGDRRDRHVGDRRVEHVHERRQRQRDRAEHELGAVQRRRSRGAAAGAGAGAGAAPAQQARRRRRSRSARHGAVGGGPRIERARATRRRPRRSPRRRRRPRVAARAGARSAARARPAEVGGDDLAAPRRRPASLP